MNGIIYIITIIKNHQKRFSRTVEQLLLVQHQNTAGDNQD
jgi:hypothetical protein